MSRALLLTYTAKKRAEVAPGVGVDTDMFCIRGVGQYFGIGSHVIEQFESRYEAAKIAHAQVEQLEERNADEYVAKLSKAAEQPGSAEQQTAIATPPVDGIINADITSGATHEKSESDGVGGEGN